ncbi:MAG: type restriction enzyme subunit, partial [Pseudomonadota bacterium]|nr:type restriction enzyme subunit [Pseudomonadota bacterium]
EPNALVVNIVFAWEQAVAVTTEREKGMVASHRFPMYVAKESRAEPEFVLGVLSRNRRNFRHPSSSPATSSSRSIILPSLWKV